MGTPPSSRTERTARAMAASMAMHCWIWLAPSVDASVPIDVVAVTSRPASAPCVTNASGPAPLPRPNTSRSYGARIAWNATTRLARPPAPRFRQREPMRGQQQIVQHIVAQTAEAHEHDRIGAVIIGQVIGVG